jgi:hypothetical protein
MMTLLIGVIVKGRKFTENCYQKSLIGNCCSKSLLGIVTRNHY